MQPPQCPGVIAGEFSPIPIRVRRGLPKGSPRVLSGQVFISESSLTARGLQLEHQPHQANKSQQISQRPPAGCRGHSGIKEKKSPKQSLSGPFPCWEEKKTTGGDPGHLEMRKGESPLGTVTGIASPHGQKAPALSLPRVTPPSAT